MVSEMKQRKWVEEMSGSAIRVRGEMSVGNDFKKILKKWGLK